MRSGRRGRRTSRPAELARRARHAGRSRRWRIGQARYAARSLRMWWTADEDAMLHLHGELPDVLGVKVEATINRMTDRARCAPEGSAVGAATSTAPRMRSWGCVTRWRWRSGSSRRWLANAAVVGGRGPAAWAGGDRGDPAGRRGGRAVAGDRERSSRCWSTTRVWRWRRASARRACHPRWCGRCLLRDGHCRSGNCEVRYGLHDPSPATAVVGWERRSVEPGRGVRCPPASPEAGAARTVGAGRQPQPARRVATRPPRRPHPRTGRTARRVLGTSTAGAAGMSVIPPVTVLAC